MTLFLMMAGWLWGILSPIQQQLTATPPPPLADTVDTSSTSNSVGFEPFTQADLNVITGNVQRPNGMVWFEGKLYIVCTGDWTIYEVDSVTGDTRTYVYGIRNGHALFAESAGAQQGVRLWAPDFDREELLDIVTSRSPRSVLQGFDNPWGIAALDDTWFVITNLGSGTVDRVSRTGERITVMEGFRSPAGIAVDEERVYIANSGSARRSIEWIDKEAMMLSDTVLTPSPLVQGLQNTSSLVMASDGYLYFTYALGTRGVVGRVQPQACVDAGGCENDQIEVVAYTDLSAPLAGLTISDDMRLFVHTMFRPEIYWVQLPIAQANE